MEAKRRLPKLLFQELLVSVARCTERREGHRTPLSFAIEMARFAPAVYKSSVREIYGGDPLARSLKRSLCNVSARDLGKRSSVKISCKDLCTSVLYRSLIDLCVADPVLFPISARDLVWWDI